MRKTILTFIILFTLSFSISAQEEETAAIFKDTRDGHEYPFVKIGNQTWMAQNLDYKTPNSVHYENKSVYTKDFGRLYTWDEAKTACPDGWHLPSDQEWKILEKNLGISDENIDKTGPRGNNVVDKLNNDFGFNLTFGGHFFYEAGEFLQIREAAHFWTSTELNEGYAYQRIIFVDKQQIIRDHAADKRNKLSVRCIKD